MVREDFKHSTSSKPVLLLSLGSGMGVDIK